MFKREALELHDVFSDILQEGGIIHIVDDYLYSIEALQRIPTKYDSNVVCYLARGVDHTRCMTLLVNAKENRLRSSTPRKSDRTAKYKSYSSLVAANLISSVLTMKRLSENKNGKPPIDVSFILVGDETEKHEFQQFRAQKIKESVTGGYDVRWGTHVIIVESTGLKLCNVQKGCLVFRLGIKGQINHPAFPWLVGNPWDALARFNETLTDAIRPRHSVYPVEAGSAPPLIRSHFLLGFPTMAPISIKSEESTAIGESSSLEAEYYLSVPPEFPYENFKKELVNALDDSTKRSGCQGTIVEIFEEVPFHEDPHSAIIEATSKAFIKSTGYEPIFEWLPFPVQARELKSSGIAKDVVVFGPGDLTMTSMQDRKNTVTDALKASEVLAQIPYELAESE